MHFKCERQPRVINCAFDQTNKMRLVKSAVYDVGQQGVLGIVQIEDKQQNDAKCLQS